MKFILALVWIASACSSICLGSESKTDALHASVLDKAVVFSALESAKKDERSKTPLAGSFADGEKMLRSADPETEANIVFNEKGMKLIQVCGFACLAPGIDAKLVGQTESVTLPATSDTLSESNKGYNQAAQEFAERFNKQMVARQNPPAKGLSSIPKALSDSELTLNGVTIGKSNLYNAIGRFGTNMFHKEGDGGSAFWVVCWKGQDGTTLAYESGEAGGRDQTILEGRLIANGVEYAHAKYCKDSKKVSAALSLLGIRLGDSVEEAEKKRGPPSTREDQRLLWHYEITQKKKTLTSDVEIASGGGKVNEISVGKEAVQ